MLWLVAHMQLLLFAAFFIGLGVGWWIWGARTPRSDALPPRKEALMGTLNSDFRPPANAAPAAEAAPQKDNAAARE